MFGERSKRSFVLVKTMFNPRSEPNSSGEKSVPLSTYRRHIVVFRPYGIRRRRKIEIKKFLRIKPSKR
ncbi:MAG: hypothetical protein COW21_00740 [Candidatus Aenigmarchaeota archaeon CG15_BIG_FIL_POST_REV_8_21_14_020_37_27]|nr:MAG: hypothetical protein COW21_00740 [Candidatus Aenigmarchaeota archaeon CG15_BIG_FIL_POST_REV_8_21_14_020_37_27]